MSTGQKSKRRHRTNALVDQRGIPHTFDFTPGPDGGAEYKIRGIPSYMWRSVRAKARREHRSVRAVVLGLLQEWIESEPAA